MSGAGCGPAGLSAGCRITLAGTQWQVQEFEPHTGRVLLRGDGGQELATTVRALVNRSDCRPAGAGLPHRRGRQPMRDLAAQPTLLDSAANHGLTAFDAVTTALNGKPWLPLPAIEIAA